MGHRRKETALKLRAPDDANLLQLSKWNDNDGEIKKMLENSYKSGDMEHTPKISFRAMTRSKTKSMNLADSERLNTHNEGLQNLV